MKITLEAQILEELIAPHREKLVPFKEWLVTSPPEGVELIRASTFQDETALRQAVERLAEAKKLTELKVAAALWDRQYSLSVGLLPLLLMAVGGVALEVEPENISLIWRDGEYRGAVLHEIKGAVYLPGCPSSGLTEQLFEKLDTPEELYYRFWENLVEKHLALYIEHMYAATRLSKKILWGNLGNLLYSGFGLVQDTLGIATAGLARAALLDRPEYPALIEGKNPLYRPVIHVQLDDPALPDPVPVRTTCCLMYKLPEHNYCGTCPIPKPAERIERWKQIKVMQAQAAEKGNKE